MTTFFTFQFVRHGNGFSPADPPDPGVAAIEQGGLPRELTIERAEAGWGHGRVVRENSPRIPPHHIGPIRHEQAAVAQPGHHHLEIPGGEPAVPAAALTQAIAAVEEDVDVRKLGAQRVHAEAPLADDAQWAAGLALPVAFGPDAGLHPEVSFSGVGVGPLLDAGGRVSGNGMVDRVEARRLGQQVFAGRSIAAPVPLLGARQIAKVHEAQDVDDITEQLKRAQCVPPAAGVVKDPLRWKNLWECGFNHALPASSLSDA